jgi:hypothetical protein
MDKERAAGIPKGLAYLFQAAFFALGFTMSSLFFGDPDVSLLACSTGYIVQIAVILWFCKTYRGYVGKTLWCGSIILSVAIIFGSQRIYEARSMGTPLKQLPLIIRDLGRKEVAP